MRYTPTIRCITSDYSPKARQDFQLAMRDPHMEEAVSDSMNSRLCYIVARVNDRGARPYFILSDTGCSMTCIRESTWLSMKRHKNEDFKPHEGVLCGVGGETSASIVGTANLKLFMMDKAGEIIEITTRAMIIRGLQGPLFLGQDIFENSNIFSHLTSSCMELKSPGKTHEFPFHTGHSDTRINICNQAIPVSQLIMRSLGRTCIKAGDTRFMDVYLRQGQWNHHREVRMVPLSDIPQDLGVMPCINFLFDNRSSVMVCNNTNKDIWISPDSPVCLIEGSADTENYSQVFQCRKATEDEELNSCDNFSLGGSMPDADEELEMLERDISLARSTPRAGVFNVREQVPGTEKPELRASHILKSANAAITSKIDIPEEFDILKRPRTLNDEQLLDLFDLDHLRPSLKAKVKALILEYTPVWSEHSFDLGLHNQVEHDIVLEADLPPCPKQRFWPSHKRAAAEELIDNLEKFKIVEKCIANWATNIVLIQKQADPANAAMEQPLLDCMLDKNTIPTPAKAKYRLCLDLRPTNSVTRADVATLGNMDAMFMQLSGKKCRSSFDFTNGFFQIGLTKQSKGTTFFVHRKSGSCIMRFNRSIQGSKNASSVFVRAMEVSYEGLRHVLSNWIDDLILFSETEEEHLQHLRLMLQRTLGSNMKLSPAKAKFFAASIKYLGMNVEGDTFSIADSKLKAIDNLVAPKNYVQLRSQFALFQYYKKFCPFFSEITQPLQRMMKKNVIFEWTKECTDRYVLLKSLFKERISLHLPNAKHTYVIHTDASSYASSATLHQRVDGELVPVAFHSEAFTGPQIGYSILDKELYSMVDAIKRFEYYVSGTCFEVFTDSKVLLYLRKAKDSNPKLLRWSLLLQAYDFTITHLSSAQNKIADILSRPEDEGKERSHKLHTAKKAILEKLRQDVSQVFIPEGRSLNAEQVVTLLQSPAEDRGTETLQHEAVMTSLLMQIPEELRLNESLRSSFCEKSKPVPKAPMSIFTGRAGDNLSQTDLSRRRLEEIVAATSFQDGGMRVEDLIRLQSQDSYCQEIEKVSQSPGMREIYRRLEGVWVKMPPKVVSSRPSLARVIPRIIVPECLTSVLIDRLHAGPAGAHVGHTRVYATLKKKYHFKDMQSVIRMHIGRCIPCQLNMYTTRSEHKQHLTTNDNVPRRTVLIDLSTDYPPVQGFKHVMVMVDVASNYVSLKPLKSKSSKEMLTRFKEYVASFGLPSRVRHDQEKGLVEGVFHQFCEELSIEQVLGLPNKPRTNGRVEAQVRNMSYSLKSLTTANSTKGNWPNELWRVQLAMNTAVSRATLETPEMMLFGYELPQKSYELIETSIAPNSGVIRHSLAERTSSVADARQESQLKQLDIKNARLREGMFKPGDLVWRQIMQPSVSGVSHALDHRYKGPFKIMGVSDSTAVLARNAVSNTGLVSVHLDQLKPFLEGEMMLSAEWDALVDHKLNLQTRTSRRKRPRQHDNSSSSHRSDLSGDEDLEDPLPSIPGLTGSAQENPMPSHSDPSLRISTSDLQTERTSAVLSPLILPPKLSLRSVQSEMQNETSTLHTSGERANEHADNVIGGAQGHQEERGEEDSSEPVTEDRGKKNSRQEKEPGGNAGEQKEKLGPDLLAVETESVLSEDQSSSHDLPLGTEASNLVSQTAASQDRGQEVPGADPDSRARDIARIAHDHLSCVGNPGETAPITEKETSIHILGKDVVQPPSDSMRSQELDRIANDHQGYALKPDAEGQSSQRKGAARTTQRKRERSPSPNSSSANEVERKKTKEEGLEDSSDEGLAGASMHDDTDERLEQAQRNAQIQKDREAHASLRNAEPPVITPPDDEHPNVRSWRERE